MILILLFFSAKDPKRKTLAKGLEEEENLLKQCIEKLKLVEASRVALVSQLKEALHEQVCYHILLLKLFYVIYPHLVSGWHRFLIGNLLLSFWIFISGI